MKKTIIFTIIFFILITVASFKLFSVNPSVLYKRLTYKPTVSVVLPSYNMGNTLPEAIDSVINQTYKDWELVVINDGSLDNTREVLKAYKNNYKIRVLHNRKNIGLVRTLNRGIKAARGKYIARLDADDISIPDRFERQVNLMEKENLDLLSQTHYYDTKNIVIKPDILDTYTTGMKLLISVYFSHSSVMMRKDFLVNHNIQYNINYPNAEDYDLYLAIFFNGGKIGDMGGHPVSIYRPAKHSRKYRRIQYLSTRNIRRKYLSEVIPNFNSYKLLPLQLCELLPHVIDGNAKTQVLDNEKIKQYYALNCQNN